MIKMPKACFPTGVYVPSRRTCPRKSLGDGGRNSGRKEPGPNTDGEGEGGRKMKAWGWGNRTLEQLTMRLFLGFGLGTQHRSDGFIKHGLQTFLR
jgi:hypothetical protein